MEITSVKPTERKQASLSFNQRSTKRVSVTNESTNSGKFVTKIPFPQLSEQAAEASTFQEFVTSLMSVGKTVDDDNISFFTKDGITVHKEQDVLITCKGAPILIGNRDEQGCYRIPLIYNNEDNDNHRVMDGSDKPPLAQM